MAAANSDLLRKLSRKWVGQVGAAGISDDVVTTLPLSSTTNLATDTAVTLVIDRVDSSGTKTPSLEETIVGVVSGSNIVNALRGVEGTAQAHLAGAVVEVLVTADGYNDIIDHLLVGHLQDGRHAGSAITASNLAASSVTSGRISASAVVATNLAASAVVAGNLAASAVLSGNIAASAIVLGNLAASSVSEGNLNFTATTPADGWLAATGTWTYASANTITVPSGAAAIYQVGDRVKWTQTGVRYGVITAVADTLLTIAVNTDYVVDNAAITAPFYSHQASPVGYPQWFAYTATFAWDGTPPAGSTTSVSRFAITGRTCTVMAYQNNTSAGTGNSLVSVTTPVASALTTAGYIVAGNGRVATTEYNDNAGAIATITAVLLGSDSKIYQKFASSAVKSMAVTVSYQI